MYLCLEDGPRALPAMLLWTGGEGASKLVPTQCNNQKSLCYDIKVDSVTLEHREGWGSLGQSCCYGSISTKWEELRVNAPVIQRIQLRRLDENHMYTWQISTQQNQGIPFFTARLHCSDPGSGLSSWAIVAWILLLLTRVALISLWCIGWFHCLNLSTGPHCPDTSWVSKEGWGHYEAQTWVELTSPILLPQGYNISCLRGYL
jgi:hypothetical protein